VIEVLELGEFVYAAVQLTCEGQPKLNEQVMALTAGNHPRHGADIRDGRIRWHWSHNGLTTKDIEGSAQFWTLRLPLSGQTGSSLGYVNLYRQFDGDALLFDVNYLTMIFHPAVAQSVERIFASCASSEGEAASRHFTATAR
jgi:hypothetical protein